MKLLAGGPWEGAHEELDVVELVTRNFLKALGVDFLHHFGVQVFVSKLVKIRGLDLLYAFVFDDLELFGGVLGKESIFELISVVLEKEQIERGFCVLKRNDWDFWWLLVLCFSGQHFYFDLFIDSSNFLFKLFHFFSSYLVTELKLLSFVLFIKF